MNDATMETANKETLNMFVQLPPPPPPPSPSKLSKPKELTTSVSDELPDTHEEVTRALRRSKINLDDPGKVALSFYRQVKPVIQDGPMCGLVALKMACQLLSPDQFSIETIFSAAKGLKFTKFGEMFSAENMGILAEALLHCKKEILIDLMLKKSNILKHILEGWPVLFPYDCDKNHEPCCQKGHSAHWAVVTGLCITVSHNVCVANKLQLNDGVYHFSDGLEMLKILDAAESIYVYAHQGKSKHLAAWNLNSLLLSNMNLVEISDRCKNSEMVLPCDTNLCGLQNKAVLLSL